MFYVYVLKSQANGDIYIGYTDNLRRRFKEHNLGKSLSTKVYRPWELVYYEAYRTKSDATKREIRLKMHAVKKELVSRIIESLK